MKKFVLYMIIVIMPFSVSGQLTGIVGEKKNLTTETANGKITYECGTFVGSVTCGGKELSAHSPTDKDVFLASYDNQGALVWAVVVGTKNDDEASSFYFFERGPTVGLSSAGLPGIEISCYSQLCGTESFPSFFPVPAVVGMLFHRISFDENGIFRGMTGM